MEAWRRVEAMEPGQRGKRRLQQLHRAAWKLDKGWGHKFFKRQIEIAQEQRISREAKYYSWFRIAPKYGGHDMALIALRNGDIVKCQHPDDPSKTVYKEAIYSDTRVKTTKESRVGEQKGAIGQGGWDTMEDTSLCLVKAIRQHLLEYIVSHLYKHGS